jgi:hypothetical protein
LVVHAENYDKIEPQQLLIAAFRTILDSYSDTVQNPNLFLDRDFIFLKENRVFIKPVVFQKSFVLLCSTATSQDNQNNHEAELVFQNTQTIRIDPISQAWATERMT